jgi:hypothetical protein
MQRFARPQGGFEPMIRAIGFVAMLAAPATALAGFDSLRALGRVPVLDVLEVLVRDDEILAVDGRLGGGAVRERLEVEEQVVWADARGEVGVVITNRRILAATPDVPRWMFTRIGVHESRPLAVVLGDRVALILTDHRAIGVAAQGRKKFFAETITPHESVLDFLVGESVAVIVTDKRLLGMSAFLPGFVEQRIGIHEKIQDVATLADFATVATHRRLLIFRAPMASWQEQQLSLR